MLRTTIFFLTLIGVIALPGVIGAQSVGVDLDVGVEATTNDDTSTSSIETDATLTGGLEDNGLGVEILTSGQVNSDADLETFSENLRIRDTQILDANADASGSADLTYYHPGRLFGIFPVQVEARTWVSTNQDGELEANTTLPWWGVFVTGTGQVRTQVDSTLEESTAVAANLRAGADASARARVLEAIANAHAQANTEVTASVE